MMWIHRWGIAKLGTLAVVIALSFASQAFADQGSNPSEAAATMRSPDEVSRITRDVSQEIFSPYCPGKTLAMCPSGNASDARREVQAMAQRGMDKEAIKTELLNRYGEEFRVVEPSAEDNYTLLGAVVASFGLSIFAVAFLVRRRRGTSESDVADEELALDQDALNETDGYLEDLRAEYLD